LTAKSGYWGIIVHHPVDVHVGARLRQRRALLGMSQTALGNAVGLTFQQVQKYERGGNRISSSRLYEFAKVLDVPVSFFFEEMSGEAATGKKKPGRQRSGPPGEDINTKRETLELVRAYYKIANPIVRNQVRRMVQAVGAGKAD
jgi:transcriptional regulator with XRE-family HTH domain